MASKFKELTLELIEEGRFMDEAAAEFRKMQAEFVAFTKQHGGAAEKAKAILTLKVALIATDPGQGQFAVASDIEAKAPTRPKAVSYALSEESEKDGEGILFVRHSGSSDIPPKQGVLATKDGRVVKPK